MVVPEGETDQPEADEHDTEHETDQDFDHSAQLHEPIVVRNLSPAEDRDRTPDERGCRTPSSAVRQSYVGHWTGSIPCLSGAVHASWLPTTSLTW